uniref:Ice-binding protein C-terminal domain-containing protein n=1 Tax=Dechloromonas aromatica (strain RCB) TaxID=159087 RepID=Q47IQ9_DECAR
MTFGTIFKKTALSAALALALAGSATAAVTYNQDLSAPSDIPGLTGFQTTGAMMGGMQVVATFVEGNGSTFTESRSWAATGATSGGVTGTGWSLTQTGDTYAGLWSFNFTNVGTTAPFTLLTLSLNGNSGLTLFDRYFDGTAGTTGSFNGTDLSFTDGTISAAVTYSDVVGVGGALPVEDIFHQVFINFREGIATSFQFLQDTDNDSRFNQPIPEPGTLSLLGLALAGASWRARRRQASN